VKVTLIAAMAENRVIGKDNDLIWHLPDDLKHFKKLTSGGTVIMGRKTYESMMRPLPNRTNIVITRNGGYVAKGCTVVQSLKDALKICQGENPYIIGGAQIYSLAMPLVDVLELTVVHEKFDGDTYFPEFDEEKWEITNRQHHPKDEKHPHSFTFLTYERKLS
jgi:dihydrofolate reductase